MSIADSVRNPKDSWPKEAQRDRAWRGSMAGLPPKMFMEGLPDGRDSSWVKRKFMSGKMADKKQDAREDLDWSIPDLDVDARVQE